MYSVDRNDVVAQLDDIPRPAGGAPLPALIATDDALLLAYLGSVNVPPEERRTPVSVSGDSRGSLIRIRFIRPRSHVFGSPNDEALSGHPLYDRGLRHYAAYEVKSSSWVRSLERMNSVHPQHTKGMFESCRHIIITFHDSTFECVADGYDVNVQDGSRRSVLLEMARIIGDDVA